MPSPIFPAIRCLTSLGPSFLSASPARAKRFRSWKTKKNPDRINKYDEKRNKTDTRRGRDGRATAISTTTATITATAQHLRYQKRTFRVARMIFSAAFLWLSSLRPMSRGACEGPRDLDLDPPVRVTTLSERFACGVVDVYHHHHRQQHPITERKGENNNTGSDQ